VVDDKDKSAEGSIREENERYKDVVRSPGNNPAVREDSLRNISRALPDGRANAPLCN